MYDDSTIYWEQLTQGQVYEYGHYQLTEESIIAFAKQFDPMPFHVCPEKAKKSPFGQLIASGLHTLSINQRMSFDHIFSHWAVVAGKEMTQCKFLAPVFAGDVLSARLIIDELSQSGNSGRGSVHFTIVTLNQHNQPVLQSSCEMILARKKQLTVMGE